MKKKSVFLVIAIVIVAAISLRFVFLKKNYELVSPKRGDVLEAIYGLGKVKSDETYEIKIGVLSQLENVYVKEGDFVEKGAKLLSFEKRSTFNAPFSGTVTEVNFKVGEMCLPQATILRMENLKRKYIEVSLEQDAALKVKKSQKTSLVFESQSQVKSEGVVTSIYPKDGEFLTRVDVNKLDANILPGMTADVVIEIGKKENALLIPARAISDGYVLRVRDKKRKKVSIETGHSDGMWVEVVKGDFSINDSVLIKR